METEAKELLRQWREGNNAARDRLIALLHSELSQISAALLRAERNNSLATGELVNEAVLRLIQFHKIDWNDKCHFLALSARVMRQVLLDKARRRNSDKRAHHRVTLITNVQGVLNQIDIHDLESALIRLAAIDADKAAIVELRYFGGMNIDEVAEVMGTSQTSVKRQWRAARAFLLDALMEAQDAQWRLD